jgi:alpha-D-ribose 1-methylphosphonate 5-triphosphate synthase subunit PhnG
MTGCDESQAARRRWLAVLARSSRTDLEQALARQVPPVQHQVVRAPECGMVMVRARAGGTGEPFHFGEATVTRCAIRLGEHLGVGYALGRDRRKCELIALFDALLQDPARREELLAGCIGPLERQQAHEQEAQARAAAASRVEFFTLVRGEA